MTTVPTTAPAPATRRRPHVLVVLAVALTALLALPGLVGAQGTVAEGVAPPISRGVAGAEPSTFVPIWPCRIVNTQNSAGPLAANEERFYRMHGNTSAQGGAADCGIPQAATALEMTITSVSAAGDGYLRVGSVQQSLPTATFLNYSDLMNIGNTGAVPVSSNAQSSFRIRAFVASTHVVVDVNGYYLAA
jgi:hypothetical protein